MNEIWRRTEELLDLELENQRGIWTQAGYSFQLGNKMPAYFKISKDYFGTMIEGLSQSVNFSASVDKGSDPWLVSESPFEFKPQKFKLVRIGIHHKHVGRPRSRYGRVYIYR